MKKKIKIAVADDHQLIRQGIISLIHEFEGLEVIYEAENGEVLCNLVKKKEPDVILLDIAMPVMDGIKATEYLHQNHPKVKILILTNHNDEQMIIHLIQSGAHGFLLKDTGIETIVDSIHSVMKSGYYFNDHVPKEMLKSLMNSEKITPHFKKVVLSEREIGIIKLICKEKTNREIADTLCIAVRTVDWHRENILKKIDAKNTAGIVMYAINNKLSDSAKFRPIL